LSCKKVGKRLLTVWPDAFRRIFLYQTTIRNRNANKGLPENHQVYGM